jgi:DNA-directed RNA polymerase specialized sigma24 family protein
MSWSEIAEALGAPETSVKRDYARALTKLRREMAKEGVTEEEFVAYMVMRFKAGSLC